MSSQDRSYLDAGQIATTAAYAPGLGFSREEYQLRMATFDQLWDRTDKDMTDEQLSVIYSRWISHAESIDLLEVRPGEFVRGRYLQSARAVALGTYLGPLVIYDVVSSILGNQRIVDVGFMVTTQLARSGLFRNRYVGDQVVYAIERHFGLNNNRNLHERLQIMLSDLQQGVEKWLPKGD